MSDQQLLQQLIGPDYVLNWVVGNGGMSTVWLADDVRNEREVAIKVLKPEFSDNEEFLSRFRNEALASENIVSENIVQTYDYRESIDDTGRTFCFIVMEFIRGESLADMIERKGTIPEESALDFLEQAAHGLASIHGMGLVHRDIKPGNLLITQNGRVKITDFGIAKAAASVPLTRTGMVVGTAQYVSPEQAQGKDVTPATDVYSLAVVGYEILAGRRPFTGDSSVSVAIAHINQAPPPLPTSITAPTRELIGIALRKEPEHRYANGGELEKAISAARLGKRPPRPQATPAIAAAPAASATAVTSNMPVTTLGPSQSVAKPPVSQAIPAARREPEKSGSSFALGLGLSVILLALVGAGVYLFSTGFFGDGMSESSSRETPTLETVTVTEEPTTEKTTRAPAPAPRPQPETTPSEPPQESTTVTPSEEPPVETTEQLPTMVLPEPPTTIPSNPPTVTLPESQPDAGTNTLNELTNPGAGQ